MTKTIKNVATVATETVILDANGNPITAAQPVDLTLKEVVETMTENEKNFINEGINRNYTTFDMDSKRTREKFVKTFGTDLTDITSLEAALKLSGLDFEVQKVPLSVNINQGIKGMPPKFVKIPNSYCAMRMDTREVIGVNLAEDYEIYQNRESFDFLDSLYLEGARFTNATMWGGSKRNGRPDGRILITMELPQMKILDDEYTPYLMFLNGFDRGTSFICAFTHERVVCANMVARALRGNQNRVSIRHTKTMRDKVEMAHTILGSNQRYMELQAKDAELLALKPFSENDFLELTKVLLPVGEDAKDFMVDRVEGRRDAMMVAYRQPDLANYNNSAYRAIQALADFESHEVRSNRGGSLPTSFRTIVQQGMPLTNKAFDILMAR